MKDKSKGLGLREISIIALILIIAIVGSLAYIKYINWITEPVDTEINDEELSNNKSIMMNESIDFHYRAIPHCDGTQPTRCWIYENETMPDDRDYLVSTFFSDTTIIMISYITEDFVRTTDEVIELFEEKEDQEIKMFRTSNDTLYIPDRNIKNSILYIPNKTSYAIWGNGTKVAELQLLGNDRDIAYVTIDLDKCKLFEQEIVSQNIYYECDIQ